MRRAMRRGLTGATLLLAGCVGDRVRAEMDGFLARYRRQLDTLLVQRPDDPQAPAWRDEMARIDAGAALFPTHAVTAPEHRRIAGRRVFLELAGDAVSGGDVWVYDPATRTLAAGDLVTLPVPFADTACPQGWSRALAALDAVAFERLVPGHGEPLTHAQFRRYRHAFDRLLICAAGPHDDAACAEDWTNDLGDLLPLSQRPQARRLLVDYYLPARLQPGTERPGYCRD